MMSGEDLRRFAKYWSVVLALTFAGPATAFDYSFESSNTELRDRLAGVARLTLLKQDSPDAPVQDIVSAAQSDYRTLTERLYSEGYFAGTVNIRIDGREAADISQVDPPPSVSSVRVTVQTGAPFRFGRVTIQPLAEGTVLPAGFATGEPASLSVMRSVVDAGIEGWRQTGHAKAGLASQTVTANHATNSLAMEARIDPGPRLRFGALAVSGETAVRPERVREIAGLPEGATFDPDELASATRRLRRTGTFSAAILTEAETASTDGTLPITAEVSDRLPRGFGAGGEISSLDGIALSAYWLHRNLMGGAERLRFDGEVSGIGGQTGGEDARLALRYDRPATFNADTDFFAEAEIERRNDTALDTTSGTLSVGIRRYASTNRTYDFAVGLRRARTDDAFGRRDYTMLAVPLGAIFDYRDAPLNAQSGWFANVTLTPFLGLSGMSDGIASYGDLRGYYSFGTSRPVTLAGRFQIGSLAGPSLSQAPADLLFFSGGGGTVRGQPFQSNAINLGGGLQSGGRSFLGLSAELRIGISDNISTVLFADAGYIGAEMFPDGSGTWHSGAGVGLRYDTGIGPLRFDVGLPVSGPGNDGFQIYIGIGQAF